MEIKLTVDAPGLVDAINNLAAAVAGSGSAPAAPATEGKKAEPAKGKKAEPAKAEEPKAEEKAEPKYTLEEVRAKLKDYAAIEGKDAAIKILKDNGAASISELDEAAYEKVVAACGG